MLINDYLDAIQTNCAITIRATNKKGKIKPIDGGYLITELTWQELRRKINVLRERLFDTQCKLEESLSTHSSRKSQLKKRRRKPMKRFKW